MGQIEKVDNWCANQATALAGAAKRGVARFQAWRADLKARRQAELETFTPPVASFTGRPKDLAEYEAVLHWREAALSGPSNVIADGQSLLLTQQ